MAIPIKLRNMEKSEKIEATSDHVALQSSAIEYEKQLTQNTLRRTIGIPPITTILGGSNDSARRQRGRGTEEGGDYMPLEDKGDNATATATKASMSRIITDTRMIRTRATSWQANDVMLSPVDMPNGSSQQVRRDNAANSSVREGKCSLLGYLLLLIFLYLHNSVRSIFLILIFLYLHNPSKLCAANTLF
ncbi:hypothetical protein Cgig2_004267 [Carnegiea gigantea]|uniref:Uncharacterized protein n=1 Tax=Carnegiea gigantea TaxID=171969 RepID=A0A9Q1KGZ3_9CARY|nr:hypothetical protein Cgig2_004267 [Carnegiea gigantea]